MATASRFLLFAWWVPALLAFLPGEARSATCTVSLTAPAASATGTQSPQFRWTGNCSQYRVYYSPSGTFGADKLVTSWQTGKVYQMSESVWDGYLGGAWSAGIYWKVQGKSADGTLTTTSSRLLLVDPDLDDDGFSQVAGSDCDDDDPTTHPGAPETCDDADNDCNGTADDGLTFTTSFPDFDGDGHGDLDFGETRCDGIPVGNVLASGDCDDSDPLAFPGGAEECDGVDNDCDGNEDEGLTFTPYYRDVDEDGYGYTSQFLTTCDGPPAGYTTLPGDCDEDDALVHPGASEECDDTDNDCDGSADDSLTFSTWYPDADGDGYGRTNSSVSSCVGLVGYALLSGDCNEGKPTINPGRTETCNALDDNCNGLIDDGLAVVIYHPDFDGDGYGTDSISKSLCNGAPVGFVSQGGDCAENNASIHPGASEVCNGVDDDCSGEADDGLAFLTWYPDDDQDGFGPSELAVTSCAGVPLGTVLAGEDCDDQDADMAPSLAELCDGKDNDCNGEEDDGFVFSPWYLDFDGDGYGLDAFVTETCDGPPDEGYVGENGDCDEGDDAIHPGAEDACADGVDSDCDGNPGHCDGDEDGYTTATDCDDTTPVIHPGATERCNSLDEDCDGLLDEEAVDSLTWHRDADEDGYGDPASLVFACSLPQGAVFDATDCDDASASIHPGASESCNGLDENCDGTPDENPIDPSSFFADADQDGYGNLASSTLACEVPEGFVSDATDCDDTSSSIHPGANELCNGIDEDCDASIDEDAINALPYFADADGDGHGDPATLFTGCTRPSGFVSQATDCDDTAISIHPGADETCNGIDEDCDASIDEESLDVLTFFADIDADGYGDSSSTTLACEAPEGFVSDATDCQDSDAERAPHLPELCDGKDNNCDEVVDENPVDPISFFADADQDGYGNPALSTLACEAPEGLVSNTTDCDDTSSSIHPGADETCDMVDEDCDGEVDEDPIDGIVAGVDVDGDGYGDPGDTLRICTTPPPGTTTDVTDCNDDSPDVHPGVIETCNGIDDDCDGFLPMVESDVDGDGYFLCADDCNDTHSGVHPNASELCDETDNDCDGVVDEEVAPFSFYFPDQDGDGSGAQGVAPEIKCLGFHPGYVTTYSDCDDGNSSIAPAFPEACDSIDNNCNDEVDEDLPTQTGYEDGDGDGFGNGSPGHRVITCGTLPSGYVSDSSDCDDGDAAAWPGSVEVCDGLDNNCDGSEDEGFAVSQWYRDTDQDGYGTEYDVWSSCYTPDGYITEGTDCDDSHANAHPGLTEVCDDGLDNDCDEASGDCAITGSWNATDADSFIQGTTVNQYVGYSVSIVGDLNADGYDDVAVGAYGDATVGVQAGAVYVFYGPLTGTLSTSSADAILRGEATGDQAGFSLNGAGDVNADGYDDLLIGAPSNDSGGTNGGATYLVLGPTSGVHALPSSAIATFVSNDGGDNLGYSVSGAGDINSDGYDDVLVGAPFDEVNGAGSGTAYVWLGPISGSQNPSTAHATLSGSTSGDNFGAAVDGGQDYDADGASDVVVGAWKNDAAGTDSGAAYLFKGPFSGTLGVANASMRIRGIAAGDQGGTGVALLPDVNGDGFDDLLVGSPRNDNAATDAGAAYLFLGNTTDSGIVSMSTADLTIRGGASNNRAGTALASGGDFDGDGRGELVVAAPERVSAGVLAQGNTYVLYPYDLAGTFDLAGAATSDHAADFLGQANADKFGSALGGSGDIDGDGWEDLVVGAWGNDSGASNAGRVYIFYGAGM